MPRGGKADCPNCGPLDDFAGARVPCRLRGGVAYAPRGTGNEGAVKLKFRFGGRVCLNCGTVPMSAERLRMGCAGTSTSVGR